MNKDISIAETEWKVMEIIWENPGATFSDIKNELASTSWSDSTIKTLLRRLVAKDALGFEDDDGRYRYHALVSQDECRLKETKNLINRIYNGSVKMLMTNLVSDSGLSDDEAAKLMDIISKIEEDE